MAAAAKGLGKGLSALMNDDVAPVATVAGNQVPQRLPVEKLEAGEFQPRSAFDKEQLQELADSIAKNGILQPIIVRPLGKGRYEIIAGERRFRAAKLAKMKDVPVIIREIDNAQALEIALIENIQRAELNALEEAIAYARLMDEFRYTQDALSKTLGKSRSHVANLLRLNQLPEKVKKHITSGAMTMGHARSLVGLPNAEALAEQIVRESLNVRQAEALAQGKPFSTPTPQTKSGQKQFKDHSVKFSSSGNKDADILQLEAMLSDNLGLKVAMYTRSAQSGEVVISYESLVELDEVLRRLGGGM